MIQLIVDLYSEEQSFYGHIAAPNYDRDGRRAPKSTPEEWADAEKMLLRLSKHLRRTGFHDMRHAATYAKQEPRGAKSRRAASETVEESDVEALRTSGDVVPLRPWENESSRGHNSQGA